MWTKQTPTEKGWYWHRVDQERFPGLPAELTEPQMMWLSTDPVSGRVLAHDPAESFCEFDAANMTGYWCGPILAPEFAQVASAGRGEPSLT